jgi:hypothetical protein
MRRRRNADEVARLLREADRDLAKELTISDFCRKQGIAETTYYRWRQRHDPGQVDNDRRCRELELDKGGHSALFRGNKGDYRTLFTRKSAMSPFYKGGPSHPQAQSVPS